MKINKITGLIVLLLAVSCASKLDFTAPETSVIVGGDGSLIISEISTAINTDPNASGKRNHYIELTNTATTSINLANYAIGYQAVTDSNTIADWFFPDSTYLALSGNLPANTAYVIASPQADTVHVKSNIIWGTTSTATAAANSPLQLSGNSAIALLEKSTTGAYSLGGVKYKIIDVFGSPLVARLITQGKASARNNLIWATAGEVKDTRNRTFWRKSTVKIPVAYWSVAAGSSADSSQWVISGDKAWDYSNVGLPTK